MEEDTKIRFYSLLENLQKTQTLMTSLCPDIEKIPPETNVNFS